MQRFNDTEGYNVRESNVLRMLGYFGLIGLQRVHTLVGDYHGALKAIHPLNLFEVGCKNLKWREHMESDDR
jgi:translation initiation factor 3 subunit L